jgi:hypothetical protein
MFSCLTVPYLAHGIYSRDLNFSCTAAGPPSGAGSVAKDQNPTRSLTTHTGLFSKTLTVQSCGGDFSAAFRSSSFKLCLNPLRNGAIWLTWLSLPINLCISFKLKLSLSLAFFISAKVFCFFESGRDHVKLDVSKFIPRTYLFPSLARESLVVFAVWCQLHVNFPTQFGIFFGELLTPFCFPGGDQRYIIQLPVDQLRWYFAF